MYTFTKSVKLKYSVMKPKSFVVSYRTTPGMRRRLGALVKRSFRQAGVQVKTRKRDQVSRFMGVVTDAIVRGQIEIKPELLARAA